MRPSPIVLFALASCTAAQLADGAARVALACAVAKPLAGQALAIPEVGIFVAAGVLAVCASDAAIQRAAADPSTAEWLDRQAAILNAALHRG